MYNEKENNMIRMIPITGRMFINVVLLFLKTMKQRKTAHLNYTDR